MPNHLHLILPDGPEAKTYRQIHGILGSIAKSFKEPRLWQAVPPPRQIPDRHHLRRQVRYVALNPCRSKLCADPLDWHWSTYRDVIGAVASPWVGVSRLAHAFGESEREFKVRFHAYVSGDPSVAVGGTPFPRPAKPKSFPEQSIIEILDASAATLRLPLSQVRKRRGLRRVFVHLAGHQGWTQTQVLSQICGITPRAIQYILEQDPPESLSAAALCLGDVRLRRLMK